MPVASYSTGTVTVSASTTVTGSGTLWNTGSPPPVRPGDVFRVDGDAVTYKVLSVASDTSLTLERPYAGTPGSGLGYKVIQATVGVPGDSTGNREPQGPAGNDATVSLSPTTVVTPDTNPSVSNGGTPGAAVFTFSLPRAPTFSVGSVTGVAAGVTPTVTDVGANGDIVLNFELEQGETGPQGPQGIPGESGLPLDATIRVANFTMSVGFRYGVDTSGGAVTVSFPPSPSTGNRCGFIDLGGVADTNAITLAGNGSNIYGASDDVIVDVSRIALAWVYWDASTGWVVDESVAYA